MITFLIWQAVDEGECLLEWDYTKGDPPAPLLKDMFGSERRYSLSNYRRSYFLQLLIKDTCRLRARVFTHIHSESTTYGMRPVATVGHVSRAEAMKPQMYRHVISQHTYCLRYARRQAREDSELLDRLRQDAARPLEGLGGAPPS